MRVGDEARVLVPAELHPALGGLDDVLLVEEVDRLAERGSRHLLHQLRAEEALGRLARAVGMDEVAAAPVVEVNCVDAEAVHLPVALVDEALALASQELEVAFGNGPLEDEEPLVAEGLRVVDASCRGHASTMPQHE